jgi:L-aminopeptidase/D-esterase-like protein
MRAAALLCVYCCALGAQKPRARDLGVPFEGTPGKWNAITDVARVEVGHSTLVRGENVRTGVTIVFPRGKARADDPVFAGWFSLNGNGEMTGTTWIEESGYLEGPAAITNTHSVGVVRDAIVEWQMGRGGTQQPWSLPLVAETYDGLLNDINGFHVRKEHVFEAIANAASGAAREGNVGGGTGMLCYGFKGGIGTASRVLDGREGGYTVGVLLQANFGGRSQLMVAGVPAGRELPCEKAPCPARPPAPAREGSVIVIVATDAPLLPHQLKRLARRVPLGLARTGSTSGNGSGDIFVAFSTANAGNATQLTALLNDRLDPLFAAVVYATEEAVINALVAAETMTGKNGAKAAAIPHDALREVLRKYNR